ncbi:RcnB family protein [Rhizorhapis sp. SPR117]|uniref:RcnB family protein n=1 Tax=Rhizorhapis sp. SPR117 TaxID=2912611 RepID=UPI001F33C264|nr:RcnB family protein [Rhizorhapis sp. SPR117]
MRRILLSGLALGVAGLTSPAMAAGEAAGTGRAHISGTNIQRAMPAHPRNANRWSNRTDARWHGSWAAPDGGKVRQRLVHGFVLPRYWTQPTFYIANASAYGLTTPPYGYGWSRYYDNAVLTDRYGRVYDYRSDIHWGRSGNRNDRPVYRDAPAPQLRNYDYGIYQDDIVTYRDDHDDDAEYRGTWTGTWVGEDGRTYSGSYTGAYYDDGDNRAPHWQYDDTAPAMAPALPYDMGTYANGYYYPAPTITTVVVHPSVTTTTTTFIEEEVSYSARKKAWKPNAKSKLVQRSACACK